MQLKLFGTVPWIDSKVNALILQLVTTISLPDTVSWFLSNFLFVGCSLRKHPFLLALRHRGRFVSFRFRAKRPHRRRARRNGCFRRLRRMASFCRGRRMKIVLITYCLFFVNQSKISTARERLAFNVTISFTTRRLKSFPWDALVYGSIMAFYLNLEKLGKPERCVML